MLTANRHGWVLMLCSLPVSVFAAEAVPGRTIGNAEEGESAQARAHEDELKIYRLKFHKAEKVVSLLQHLLDDPTVTLHADERSNQLIVKAPASEQNTIAALIGRLEPAAAETERTETCRIEVSLWEVIDKSGSFDRLFAETAGAAPPFEASHEEVMKRLLPELLKAGAIASPTSLQSTALKSKKLRMSSRLRAPVMSGAVKNRVGGMTKSYDYHELGSIVEVIATDHTGSIELEIDVSDSRLGQPEADAPDADTALPPTILSTELRATIQLVSGNAEVLAVGGGGGRARLLIVVAARYE